jgi:hypothetical protein
MFSLYLLIDIRQNNLSLLQTYGSNAWRIHNYLLEATAKQTEKALEELKDMTVEVNRQRKNDQVRILNMNKKENFNDHTGSTWKATDYFGDPLDRTYFECPPN